MKDNAVMSLRVTWNDALPFPGNPIYEGRLTRMEKSWGGYNHAIIGVPEFADNSAGAFPDLPDDAILNLDANHRQELARRHGEMDAEFIAKIHRGLSRAEMLKLRRGLADRRTVKPAEGFLSIADENPLGDENVIKRAVEGAGWRITCEREDGGLPYVRELRWIWEQDKTAMILAIRTYEALFGTKGASGQGMVLKGIGAFWIKHPNADADRLVAAIRSMSNPSDKPPVKNLYDTGRAAYHDLAFVRGGSWDGVRYAMFTEYNRVSRRGKLAP